MRPAWRLATNSFSARRTRSALLVAVVAFSAMLIAAVACALASANRAIEDRLLTTFGEAEIAVEAAGKGATMPLATLDAIEQWEGVEFGVPRLEAPISISVVRTVYLPGEDDQFQPVEREARVFAKGYGVVPKLEWELRPIDLAEGRLPEAPGEVVVDTLLLEGIQDDFGLASRSTQQDNPSTAPPLSPPEAIAHNQRQLPGVGDTLSVVQVIELGGRFVVNPVRQRTPLTIVGIAKQPPLGGRPQLHATLDTIGTMLDRAGKISSISVRTADGADPAAIVDQHKDDFGDRVLVRTTSKVTANVDTNIRSSQLGFVLATALSFLCASFIIMTGLTTNVAEKQRELAVIRCIGGTRFQLASSQLMGGALVGGLGAIIGVPLGIVLAFGASIYFHEDLPSGLIVAPGGIALAAGGSLMAGLLGAAWPAWRAAKLPPLQAMRSHAQPVRTWGIAAATAFAMAAIALQLLIVGLPNDGQVIFWGYATVGLPSMFLGYFFLGVPLVCLIAKVMAPLISKIAGLPPHILERTVSKTPYRHGFTAGAMMAGLALMVSLWTNGGAILRDWLGKIEFPDAFVSGLNLTEESQRIVDSLAFVEDSCAIALLPVETDAFGVRGLQKYQTSFIAFQPGPFFRMANLTWIEGSEREAVAELVEGGAVLVAKEFHVARGLGVGDTFTCTFNETTHDFRIVGVVTSPGLEVVSKFFNIGEEYTEQSIHAVFGTRADMRDRFGSEAIHLIQMNFADDVSDEEAVATIRRELFGAGILDAGSGRGVKEEIFAFARGLLVVFSSIAVAAMLVACFGVANVIVAGIQARQFEFGVLRAVGATRGVLVRLVLGEALIIGLTACVLGTLMGLQGSWAGMRMYRFLLGLEMQLKPPPLPILAGCIIVVVVTLAAAIPPAIRLNRKRPRELLASSDQ